MAERTKIEIAADLERARGAIARNFNALREDLDVPRHVKNSVREHKTAFLGGAAVLGVLASRLFAGRRGKKARKKGRDTVKEVEEAGLALVLLRMAMKVAQPALVSLLTKKASEFAQGRTSRGGMR